MTAQTLPSLPIEGSCRCGQVRLRIDARPIVTMACHCTGCQKMTGGPYSLSVAIPADGFSVTAGDPVIGGARSEGLDHFFCPHCMSWIFTRIEAMPQFVNVRATMLDDTGWFVPFIETYTSEKLPFAETGAARSYPRFPPMEDFPALVSDYQATLIT